MLKFILVIGVLGPLVAGKSDPCHCENPCPGLPATHGMEIQCVNSQDGSTVDCSSIVPQGTVGHYQCTAAGNPSVHKGTLRCVHKGRWRGIPRFNNVATSCGTSTLDPSLAKATTPVPNTEKPDEDDEEASTTATSLRCLKLRLDGYLCVTLSEAIRPTSRSLINNDPATEWKCYTDIGLANAHVDDCCGCQYHPTHRRNCGGCYRNHRNGQYRRECILC